MSQNPIDRLREAAIDCLRLHGASGQVPLKGVIIQGEGDIGDVPIRFFRPPNLGPIETTILNAIRLEGKPLLQKQLATRTKLRLQTIKKYTPQMVEAGLLVRVALGFCLPGIDVGPADQKEDDE